MSATENIYLLSTILVEGRGNGEAQTCSGKFLFANIQAHVQPRGMVG